jgi:hypothetical protein
MRLFHRPGWPAANVWRLLALSQPSPGLQHGLPGPIRQLLVATAMDEGPALGWGEDGQEGQALAPSRLGTGTIAIAESQRKPLVLTKWPCDERTGSR